MTRGVVACAAIVTGAELLLWRALATGVHVGLVLIGHSLVVAVALGWAWRRSGSASRYDLLLPLATGALGPFGSAGVIVTVCAERLHARHRADPDMWHRTLFPPVSSAVGVRRPTGRATSASASHDGDVTSFTDILSFGAIEERQAAIAIIAQQYDPAFARALRSAPADEHNVVRVQAATAIARIERQLFERTRALEAALDRAPDDPDAIVALATHNDDQAFAGLFDAVREYACRRTAADLYARYLALRPEDASAEFRCARLLLRSGRAQEAELRFRHLVATGHPTARLWLIECLFVQRRYADVRAETAAWSERAMLDQVPEAQTALAVWGHAPEVA